jgi:hypothetical protein
MKGSVKNKVFQSGQLVPASGIYRLYIRLHTSLSNASCILREAVSLNARLVQAEFITEYARLAHPYKRTALQRLPWAVVSWESAKI